MVALGAGPAAPAAAAKPETNKLTVPLAGIVLSGGTFTGSFSISKFEARGGALYAVGMVSGAITGPAARTGITGPLALPVTATTGSPLATRSAVTAQATCDVLHLSFGGITLDLLGLDVALSPVMLDLTGGEGPVGNLVCQIVALLNTVGDVVGLVAGLLNTLLGLLGGLVGGVA
jgi:hypothetical protein